MAPVVVSKSSEEPMANGSMHQNGEPPASTLAAQLVDNLTRAKQHSRHQDREDFEQLLQIFEAEDQNQDQSRSDPRVAKEESIKLIDVVIKAGLDVLSRENPFEHLRGQNQRAIRSLKVVEVTLTRCPDALYANSNTEAPCTQLPGPVYLWLVPRLLNLTLHQVDVALLTALASTLAAVVSLERRLRSRLARLYPVCRYLQGCIKGA